MRKRPLILTLANVNRVKLPPNDGSVFGEDSADTLNMISVMNMGLHDWKSRRARAEEWGIDYWDAERRKTK